MTKALAILGFAFALAGCSSAAKVVSDHSVAQQFAAFNKSGWSVTGGGIPAPQRPAVAQLPQNAVYPKGQSPFSHAVWSTNFKVDGPPGTVAAPPAPGATNLIAPHPGFFGGGFLPSGNSNVAGQTGQAQVSH